MERWELIDYHEKPPRFERPLQTWFPSLPEEDESAQPQWLELAGLDADGREIRLRLSDAGRRESDDGRSWRGIEVLWTFADGRADRQIYPVDAEAFQAGRPPEEFLPEAAGFAVFDDGAEAGDLENRRNEAIVFFRGLPAPRRYNNEFIRYLKTPLRRDAFRCQKAAGQVYHRSPGTNRRFRHRNDLWLCNDVPFGILQIDTTVWDSAGELVARRRLKAVAASEIRASDPNLAFVRRGTNQEARTGSEH
jgi:hypothetical protein